MPPFSDIFYEIAVLLVMAGAAGTLALWLRQPLIMAFIIVGILVGPAGLDFVRSHDQVALFAKLGIALLLFVVGLKLDPHIIRTVGLVAVVVGLGQIILTAMLGYLIALALGMNVVAAFYVAVALTFSSTIIIVKLLADKREIDALHGRIALGILIMQDIVVVLVMIGLTAFGGLSQETHLGKDALMIVAKGAGLLIFLALVTRYLLPQLLHSLARSTELLILFAIAWAVGLASLGMGLGFSREVGAFLAGVTLAATPYRAILAARLVSLRDFLLLFFFIDLGVTIDIAHLGTAIGPAILFSLFVLIGKPLMVMALLGAMGYRKRTSALSSLSLGQISEFSLILSAIGLSLGHIDETTMGLITLVGLITIGVSTYMIIHAHELYERLAPYLGIFERHIPHPEDSIGDETEENQSPIDVIVFGLGRYGGNIAQELGRRGIKVLGVDFDPEAVDYWHKEGLLTFYGDAEDPEFPHALPLSEARWVVSAIPGRDVGFTLLHGLRQHGFEGRIALTTHNIQHMDSLKQAGADVVLLPFHDAAAEAADLLVGLPNRDNENM